MPLRSCPMGRGRGTGRRGALGCRAVGASETNEADPVERSRWLPRRATARASVPWRDGHEIAHGTHQVASPTWDPPRCRQGSPPGAKRLSRGAGSCGRWRAFCEAGPHDHALVALPLAPLPRATVSQYDALGVVELAHRPIVASLGVSLEKVCGALARASAAIGLDAAAIERLTDDELEAALYPKTVAAAARPVPDCASRRSAACQSAVGADASWRRATPRAPPKNRRIRTAQTVRGRGLAVAHKPRMSPRGDFGFAPQAGENDRRKLSSSASVNYGRRQDNTTT
jgi:hypothetical protein